MGGPVNAPLNTAVNAAALSGPRIEPARLALWLFLGSEALLFAGLIGAFLFLETAGGVHAGDRGVLSVPMAGFATVLLLLSSASAWRMESAANRAALLRWWLLTLLLGAAFLGLQAFEYRVLVGRGIEPRDSLYWSGFFLLTAVHGLHVLAGWVALFLCGRVSLRQGRPTLALELCGVYWHFVDAVWVLLFFLLYLT